ncbi:MAG: DUF4157 domain-containing protein [Deferribacteres bacterium]|nr:DUF4157 domain-containing protein [Deferribacteres bacterium]
MERRFGADFSSVRVHTDSNAVQMNRQLNAQAFTYGKDIYFGAGRYSPGTASGRRLLAHELTHVVQQKYGTLASQINSYPFGALTEWTIIKYKYKQEISFELADAPYPSEEELKKLNMPLPQARVYLWLKTYKNEIIDAETKFRVDRRAIAGAIAWEALENVTPLSLRAVGLGKVHYWDWYGPFFGPKKTVAEQVEESGYLPHLTEKKRKEILKTPSGSIEYIGAIMSAFADEAEKPHDSGWKGENIRLRPEILTNAYQSEDIDSWAEHLDSKKPGDELKPGTPMALWVQANIVFLEKAVGKPNVPLLILSRKEFEIWEEIEEEVSPLRFELKDVDNLLHL